MKKQLLILLLAFITSISASAYDFCVDGIYYNINGSEATVTYKTSSYHSYSGSVAIPGSVTYLGTTYSVTSIGEYAFSYCSRLSELTIPNSVTSIGRSAFRDCTGLTSINIPNSVTLIGWSAFSGCSGLTSVTIGNSVASIGDSAFSGCSGLTSVTIPNSVTEIGMWAFSDCTGLKAINYNALDCTSMNSAFDECINITTLSIGPNVTRIPSYSFNGCSGLTSVTIPNSVTEIGEGAFEGTALYNNASNWDNNVLYIGNHLISAKSGLSGEYIIKEGTLTIATKAFLGCSGLTSVTIPNSVTSIGGSAFYGTALYNDDANWENNVLYIGNHLIGAKSELSGAYTIKEGTLTVAAWAFSGCTGLTSVTIGNSVTSIGWYAFYNCSGLTSVTIPNSVTSIGEFAFYGCSRLTSVTIPNSVTSIGREAFYCCTDLKSVTIGNSVTSIGKMAFFNCRGLTSVIIPNSVTKIGIEAFNNCSGLTSVTIGNSITSIGYYAFEGTALYNDDSNWENNVLYIGKHLIKAKSGLTGKYTIKEGTLSIADDAFYDCTGLTSVTIPNSVNSIGSSVFRGCSGLKTLRIEDSDTELNFVYYPFTGCEIENLYVGRNLSSWQALFNSSILKEIELGNSVTSIGSYAFYDCSGLTSVTIPNSVTTIGKYAFYGCTALKTIYNYSDLTFTKGLRDYGYVAYYADKVYNQIAEIGNDFIFQRNGNNLSVLAYKGNEENLAIPSIYEGKSVIAIADDCFKEITILKSVTIPETITSLGNRCFYLCSSLETVTIPGTISSLPQSCFNGCSSLISITMPSSITEIGAYCFADCTGLNSIEIPNNVTSIGNYAFRNCSGLTSVNIPESVTSIGSYAFQNSSKLSVDLTNSQLTIAANAFNGIRSLTVGNDITVTGKSASSGINKVIWLQNNEPLIKGNVTYVASDIAGCTTLTYLSSKFKDGVFTCVPVIPSQRTCIIIDCDYIDEAIPFEVPATASYRGVNFTVSTLGEYLLSRQENLQSIDIKSNVTEIPKCFAIDAAAVTSVVLPQGLTSIGSQAFRNLNEISKIKLPKSINSINELAFEGCSHLKTVYNLSEMNLVKGSTGDGYVAYYADRLYNNIYDVADSWIYKGNGESLDIIGYEGDATEIIVPSSYDEHAVKNIINETFINNSIVTDITIPSGLLTIDNNVFKNCTSLSNVTFEDSETSITLGKNGSAGLFSDSPIETLYLGRNVFYSDNASPFADRSSLTSLSFGENVTQINPYEFKGCSALTNVTLPQDLTSVGQHAFEGCSALVSIQLGNSVSTIAENVFAGCDNLAAITIPTTTQNIDNNAFQNCTALSNVTFEDSENLITLGKNGSAGLFSDSPIETLYLGRNVIYSDDASPFADRSLLTNLSFGENVTHINPYEFKGCSSLTDVTLPQDLASIGQHAFAGCKNLAGITLPTATQDIGNNAFQGCTSLSNVTFEDSENSITLVKKGFGGFFSDSPIETLYLGRNVTYEGSVYPFAHNTKLVNIQFGQYVTHINPYEFLECTGLTEILLPENLTVIGEHAFDSCSGIVNVTINDAATTIEKYAFNGCSNLAQVEMGESLKTIGERAFEGCSSLPQLEMKNEVESIGEYAFNNCSNLAQVKLSDALETIGNNVFSGCSSLTGIDIPASTIKIGNNVFTGCTSLINLAFLDSDAKLTIGNKLCPDSPLDYVRIGRNIVWDDASYPSASPFSGKQTLKTAWITDIPSGIRDFMFFNCGALENVYVGDNVTGIGERAFSGCQSLKKFQFGKNLQSIGEEAFSDCTGITDIFAEPSTPPVCGTQALDDLDRWTCSLHVPESAIDAYLAADQWKQFFFYDSDFQVAMNVESLTLDMGQTFMLTAVTSDSSPLRWESSNPSVAIVHPVDTEDTPSLTNSRMQAVARESGETRYEKCIVEVVGYGTATIAAFNGNNVMASCQINGKATETGIEDIQVNPEDNVVVSEDGRYSVFNLNGVCLLLNGDFEQFTNLNLCRGIYIVNGKKVLVK